MEGESVKRFRNYHRHRRIITVKNGLMFHNQDQFIPDPSQRMLILEKAYDFHQGVPRTRARIKELYWWSSLSSDVEKWVTNCTNCKDSDTTKKTVCPLFNSVPSAEGPWHKLVPWPLAVVKEPRRTVVKVEIEFQQFCLKFIPE